jgi:hypothetical protein
MRIPIRTGPPPEPDPVALMSATLKLEKIIRAAINDEQVDTDDFYNSLSIAESAALILQELKYRRRA